jgi:hypothetical protein
MDYIIFNQPGGFPLHTDTLDAMQKMYQPFINGLGSMTGSRAIISGCEEIGDKIAGGLIQIDGEMYGLIEGIRQDYITIREDKEFYEFENGESKVTVVYRYAVFGTGATSYRWEEFKRIIPLNTIQERINEKENITRVSELENRIQMLENLSSPDSLGGTIKIWCKPANQIPRGWVCADEFVGRMLMGLNPNDDDFNTVGKTGGKKEHAQTIDEMPPHDHKIYGEDNDAKLTNRPNQDELAQINNPDSTHAWRVRMTDKAGEGKPMPIMNPYRIVIFIRWVG